MFSFSVGIPIVFLLQNSPKREIIGISRLDNRNEVIHWPHCCPGRIDTLFRALILTAHLSKSEALSSFDDCFELNACYFRYYMKLPVLGEGDYGALGSILPLSCLAAGAKERLGFCLSIWLRRGGYQTHKHTRLAGRTWQVKDEECQKGSRSLAVTWLLLSLFLPAKTSRKTL